MSATTASNQAAHNGPRAYGNWTRPKSPGLLGLGAIGTAVLFVGAGITIVVSIVGGRLAGSVVAVMRIVFLLLIALRDKHGQSTRARTATRIAWVNTRAQRKNLYRSGPLGRADWGTTQLPGLAAGSRLFEFQDTYKRPFAMIQVPSTGDYTIVIGFEPDGSSLVDRE